MTGWPTKPVKWACGPKVIYADRLGLVLKERTHRFPTGLSSVIMAIGMMKGLNAFTHAYGLDMSVLFEDSSSARRFLVALGFLHLCDQK